MPEKRFSHLGMKRKISDFLRVEDGNVGKKNVLTAGTLVGASILGQMLFAALEADGFPHTDNWTHTDYTTHSQDQAPGGWSSAL